MADGQKIPTTGIGDIFLQCTKHDGTNHMAKLCDVLYVPQLCGNLISVKKLVEKGLEVHFKGKVCRIIKNGETIAEVTEHKGLFELNVSQKLLKVSEGHKVKYKAECIHVWHNRMGHRDQQAIRLETDRISFTFSFSGPKLQICPFRACFVFVFFGFRTFSYSA